jgi:hypothetical protein
MTDYVAEGVFSVGGATQAVTERTATASADTVPAGALLLVRNTGAGIHNVTLTVNGLYDGLTVTSRIHNFPAGAIRACRVPAIYGDANGRVAMAVDGTAAEVKYYVLGA